MAAATILSGRATVLFTFYPPLTATPFFYIGLVLVVVGSWIWCGLMILAMIGFKRANPGVPVPLAMFATVANAVMWLWTTVGVAAELLFQVIPAAFGWNEAIDVGLSRTLFSWTLHAIVYFWLVPAYIAFYTMAPQAAGGRLYSDTMGRLTFILFLIYSLPVGMHHLFMDPQQSNVFKFLQMSFTALVAAPTLLTVFTITASMEIDGRLRGGRGLFGWIWALPWERPMVLATGLLLHALVRRRRRAHQHELRHERHGPQHLVGDGAFPPDLRRHRGDHVLRHRLRDLASADGAHAGLAAQPAPPALALVCRHDGHDPALALSRPAGSVAPRRDLQLRRSDHRRLGAVGDRLVRRRSYPARECRPLRLEPARIPPRTDGRRRRARAAVRGRGAPAAARSREPQRVFALERAGARADARGLRLSDRAVLHLEAAAGNRASRRRNGVSPMTPAEPDALDKPWRLWASVAIISVLAFSVVFGFLILPVVQGRAAGIDAFTAICRAVGIAAGSPAALQPTSSARAEPATKVAWSTRLLGNLSRRTELGAAVAQACVGCHGERGIAADPQNPNLAGQSAAAIYKQLHDYKSGKRAHEVMAPIAQALEDQQIVDVAAHFAAANRLSLDPTTAEVPDPDINRLVERGDPARKLPACNSCHGFNAGGPIETPTLSHQNKEYLARQLRAFRDGSRRNDIYTRMRSVAEKLSDREIERLATFYATTLSY